MAADKFLCFALLVSMAVLAAGSRSPDGVAALPLRGQLVAGGDNDKNKCVYMLYYMGTGWIWKAGTDAAIGVELAAADGSDFAVGDLERWGGLMGAGHDYYERGNPTTEPARSRAAVLRYRRAAEGAIAPRIGTTVPTRSRNPAVRDRLGRASRFCAAGSGSAPASPVCGLSSLPHNRSAD
uniref:Uncharacterized protein n=1 Tax=Oryza barthii TaxID=65489 RepID=A0A0D3FWK2_9ORYZ